MILNGRDAVTAGKNDYDSEDEVDKSQGHRFQAKGDRSENMKFFLESNIIFSFPNSSDIIKEINGLFFKLGGCIPDAAMIHAARKKRQKARELGHDYIPVEEQWYIFKIILIIIPNILKKFRIFNSGHI